MSTEETQTERQMYRPVEVFTDWECTSDGPPLIPFHIVSKKDKFGYQNLLVQGIVDTTSRMVHFSRESQYDKLLQSIDLRWEHSYLYAMIDEDDPKRTLHATILNAYDFHTNKLREEMKS